MDRLPCFATLGDGARTRQNESQAFEQFAIGDANCGEPGLVPVRWASGDGSSHTSFAANAGIAVCGGCGVDRFLDER